MSVLVVIEDPGRWPLEVPGAEVIRAREYLTGPRFSEMRRARVFNLCHTYGYQTTGYYVSLLAEARGHRVMPPVSTLQDLGLQPILRIASDELAELMKKILDGHDGDRLLLHAYFGRSADGRYDRLCQALWSMFPAPLLRAELVRSEGSWRLSNLGPIATREIPDSHVAFVRDRAQKYFARPRTPEARGQSFRYDMAILYDPQAADSPSDSQAIGRFVRAARAVGIDAEIIGREDYGRLAEYDALFIRETTAVNHYTYRFARRAEAEGLVVVDSSSSILRCTNKVFLADLFARRGIPHPRTVIVHRGNAAEVGRLLGFPCVLKRPDSSFSLGVTKARDESELVQRLDELLARSELVVAQEYTPSDFDWRVGVIDGRPLYVCKYYMARGHWQIQKNEAGGKKRVGKVETMAVGEAPAQVVDVGVRAASLIGDGLYGVDIKQVDGRLYVMEVNDNPSIDGGVEDTILRDELYVTIMRYFLDRLEQRGRAPESR